MRKIFLVSLLVGFMVFGAVAQTSFGIKGGLTLGRMSHDEMTGVDEKFKMGFAGGGMMIMPLNEQMHIQAEAMYVMKGEKWDVDGIGEITVNVNVIEIPVMLRFMASKYPAVYGGPSFNYIMSAETELDGETDDIKDDLVDMSFGLSLGAQYMMDKIVFDARYDLGLTSIVDDGSGAPVEEDQGRLSTIYVTVGYLF